MRCMLPSHANCRRRLTRAAALTWRLNSESSKRLAAACPVPSAQTALRHLLHRSESGRRLPSSVSSERERETAGARRQECGLPVTGLRRGHPHCLPSLADRRHALRRPPPPPEQRANQPSRPRFCGRVQNMRVPVCSGCARVGRLCPLEVRLRCAVA